MDTNTLLNSRVRQIQWQIEKNMFSEDVSIVLKTGEKIDVRGIHTWGASEVKIGANPERKMQRHWLKICSYSLPEEFRSIPMLSEAKVTLNSKKYRVLDISETFAEYNLTMQPL